MLCRFRFNHLVSAVLLSLAGVFNLSSLDNNNININSIARDVRFALPPVPSLQQGVDYLQDLSSSVLSGATTVVAQSPPPDLSSSASSQSQSHYTKIVTFADVRFKFVVQKWYHRLSELGYTTHTIVAADYETYQYFVDLNAAKRSQQRQPQRNGGDHTNDNSEHGNDDSDPNYYYRVEHIGGPDCTYQYFNNRNQVYRRRIFASRWPYILSQLRNRTHVLLTDADNQYHRYLPMSELETSPYDIYHAFESGIPSHPPEVYAHWGFTICGGMSWLRSTPSVVSLVTEQARRCNCVNQTCACTCDDQVVLNELQLHHNIQWDRPTRSSSSPSSSSSSDRSFLWDGLTGTCQTTGSRIRVWDKHTAYRGPIPENRSHCPRHSWVTMPNIPKGYVKDDLARLWHQACGETTEV